MNKQKYQPACTYCGQMRFGATKEFKSQDEANKWAEASCECDEAVAEQSLKKAKDNIDKFKDFCVAKGGELPDRVSCLLMDILDILNDSNELYSVAIQFDKFKAKLSVNTKGIIQFNGSAIEHIKMEA